MPKNLEITLTDNILQKLKELSISQKMPVSQTLKLMLKAWYVNNEDKINSNVDQSKLKRCSIRLDEETEKIYRMFIEDSMSKLLNINDKQEKPK